MRRFALFVVFICLLIVPAAAFAQNDPQPLWDLSSVFTVNDLGFQFNYPAGWVYAADSGIQLAANKADLAAMNDSDSATQPQDYTMALFAASMDAFGLEKDAVLDVVVKAVLKQVNLTEQQRVELPVLTHRAISVIGVSSDGRPGILTTWVQDGIVVLFGVGGSEVTLDLAFSWGQILSSVAPTNALELSDDTLTATITGITMKYPDGWFTDKNNPGYVFELKSDIGNTNNPEGIAVAMIDLKIADLKIKTLDDLVTLVKAGQSWDDTIIPAEHVLADQSAVMLGGPISTTPGRHGVFAAFIIEDSVVLIAVNAPSEDKFNEFKPTFLAILKSVTAPEAAAQ